MQKPFLNLLKPGLFRLLQIINVWNLSDSVTSIDMHLSSAHFNLSCWLLHMHFKYACIEIMEEKNQQNSEVD